MVERLDWDQFLERVGVTKNTIYLWEKNKKIPKAKRDYRNARILTSEWADECIAFRNRITDPNEENDA